MAYKTLQSIKFPGLSDTYVIPSVGTGLSDDAKQALLACFEHVAWVDDDGQDYYDALEAALYPTANLVSISAVYTQSGTVYETDSLDDLKSDLVVTATYDDSSTAIITTYTLSGTLTVGTSTITVSYGGKTTTFTVTVSDRPLPSGYTKYDYVSQNGSNSGKGILTDIAMNSSYTFETEIMYTSSTTSSAINVLGTRNGSSGTKEFGVFVTPSTGKLGYWVNNADTSVASTPFTANTRTTVKYMPIGSSQTYPLNNIFRINDTDCNTGNTSSNVTFNSWLGFFIYAISASALSSNYVTDIGLHIGETKITNSSNVLLHDLVPVSDGSNIGFYDYVTESLYTSNDSTKFSVGNWT